MTPKCSCITAEQIGVGVPVSEAIKIAQEWQRECPVHGARMKVLSLFKQERLL